MRHLARQNYGERRGRRCPGHRDDLGICRLLIQWLGTSRAHPAIYHRMISCPVVRFTSLVAPGVRTGKQRRSKRRGFHCLPPGSRFRCHGGVEKVHHEIDASIRVGE